MLSNLKFSCESFSISFKLRNKLQLVFITGGTFDLSRVAQEVISQHSGLTTTYTCTGSDWRELSRPQVTLDSDNL